MPTPCSELRLPPFRSISDQKNRVKTFSPTSGSRRHHRSAPTILVAIGPPPFRSSNAVTRTHPTSSRLPLRRPHLPQPRRPPLWRSRRCRPPHTSSIRSEDR